MNNFSSWITRKYVEWQAKEGRRTTIEEFTAYLGTSRPLVNMWMNGNKKPGKENIKILSELFGNEIFDILELPRGGTKPYTQYSLFVHHQKWTPKEKATLLSGFFYTKGGCLCSSASIFSSVRMDNTPLASSRTSRKRDR